MGLSTSSVSSISPKGKYDALNYSLYLATIYLQQYQESGSSQRLIDLAKDKVEAILEKIKRDLVAELKINRGGPVATYQAADDISNILATRALHPLVVAWLRKMRTDLNTNTPPKKRVFKKYVAYSPALPSVPESPSGSGTSASEKSSFRGFLSRQRPKKNVRLIKTRTRKTPVTLNLEL